MTTAREKKPAAKRSRSRRPTASKSSSYARWSGRVTRTSNALDLREGVFTLDDPHAIAKSLLRSAQRSRRRKSEPYRSAMSMLTFYINRAGSGLGRRRRGILERAKDELRALKPRTKARHPGVHDR
ncbi:MAG: DUF3175 domain-containing protein [Dokdonella sp.]|uniref:DUF3175 domain-containing protein n=1 Tax=Dokdonella sp. TaxID=2291710 RepID=UPI003F81193C